MLALYIDKEGSAEEKLGIYFDMYDVDKNNALDMKEIKKMITAIKSQVMCQTVAHCLANEIFELAIFAKVLLFSRSCSGNLTKMTMEMFLRMSLSRCSRRILTLSNTLQMLSFVAIQSNLSFHF